MAQLATMAGVECPQNQDAYRSLNDLYFSHAADKSRALAERFEVVGTGHDDFTDRPLTDGLAAKSGASADYAILTINRLCIAFLDWVLARSSRDAVDLVLADARRFRPCP